MTYFLFDIGGRSRKAGRFLGLVRTQLLIALSERKAETGLTQQALAQKLGVHRSLINRRLSGEANLTLRSLADLAWALDMDIAFELRKSEQTFGQNISAETSTIGAGPMKVVSGLSRRKLASPSSSLLGSGAQVEHETP